ncbi:AraC family transcriptional regulator [Effusibacillus lacus]
MGMLIRAIAESIGFRSVSHFSTTFQKITGHTPSAFRQSAGETIHASTE